jgi:hypothetical protein
MNTDDEPGSGEKRARSEGGENRGGQAGHGKHQRREQRRSGGGGGQRPKDRRGPAGDRPQQGSRPARPGNG